MNFSIKSKSQSNRLKRPTTGSFSDAPETDSSTVNYVREFHAEEAPLPPESKIKPIAPIPNSWRPNKKLKNLPTLAQSDSDRQFELEPGSNPEASDSSMGFGLNLRKPGSDVPTPSHGEIVSELELGRSRENLENIPEDRGFDEYDDVPVEGFGAALLLGYGWKEGRGIGPNDKGDVKISEVVRKAGRGGLGFTGELPRSRVNTNGEDLRNANASSSGNAGDNRGKSNTTVGKEVRVVNGREMGMKGKNLKVRDGGDVLVSKSNETVKIRTRDVAEVGSEKCRRKLKGLTKVKAKDVNDMDRSLESVNWVRNHIRVRIISKELKGGRLFLKRGVVMDVVGPGVCDILIDESRELVQGVDQESLETALPKRGGPVLVLYGRHKGAYGNLLERDSDKEMGGVRDADTHELLNVKLEEIAEYTGDPTDIGY